MSPTVSTVSTLMPLSVAIASTYAAWSSPGGRFASAMLNRLSPSCTTYSRNGFSVGDGSGSGVDVTSGVLVVRVVCGAGVSASPPAAVGVGEDCPTTTGTAPVVSPGGRISRNTASAVPTSIVSNEPRYRLNEGSALAGCRQSEQYC